MSDIIKDYKLSKDKLDELTTLYQDNPDILKLINAYMNLFNQSTTLMIVGGNEFAPNLTEQQLQDLLDDKLKYVREKVSYSNIFHWIAKERKEEIFVPIPNNTSAITKLNIPYISQWDADAVSHSGDCGIASAAMIFQALGDKDTVDQLYQKYLPYKPANEYTNFTELADLFDNKNHKLLVEYSDRANGIKYLKDKIKNGIPVIVLIKYSYLGSLAKNNFNGAHFFVVTGYDDTSLYVHDPLFSGKRRELGKFFKWDFNTFLDAWGNCNLDGNPDYAALFPNVKISFLTTETIDLPLPDPNPYIEMKIQSWASYLNVRDENHVKVGTITNNQDGTMTWQVDGITKVISFISVYQKLAEWKGKQFIAIITPKEQPIRYVYFYLTDYGKETLE